MPGISADERCTGSNQEGALESMAMNIAVCPSCGSKRIKKVRRKWSGEYKGRAYAVPELEYFECPDCGEKVYGRDAMQKIQSCSPAFAPLHSGRKSA